MKIVVLLALPLQLLTGLVVAVGVTYLASCLYQARPKRAVVVGAVLGGWLAAYGVILVVVSLSSAERVLGLDQPKRFCGFYLDCHAMVSVQAVDRTRILGEGASQAVAVGEFYVVTIERTSDADNVPIGLSAPEAVVVDADGRRYGRSAAGEIALARLNGPQPPLDRAITSGEAYSSRVVFDLPSGVRDPRLLVVERDLMTRLSELFLIGDEDSLFHRPTLFRLAS